MIRFFLGLWVRFCVVVWFGIFLWVLFACLFVLTSTDTERVFSEGKSTSVVSEPAGACPPTSGCLMADQMKENCMELEGGSEAGNSLGSTLGVYILRMVLTLLTGPARVWTIVGIAFKIGRRYMVNVCLLCVCYLCLVGVKFLLGAIRSGGSLWVKSV